MKRGNAQIAVGIIICILSFIGGTSSIDDLKKIHLESIGYSMIIGGIVLGIIFVSLGYILRELFDMQTFMIESQEKIINKLSLYNSNKILRTSSHTYTNENNLEKTVTLEKCPNCGSSDFDSDGYCNECGLKCR